MLSNILPSRNQCKSDSTNIYRDNKIWEVIMVPDMLWTIAINVTRWLIQPISRRFLGKTSYFIFLCSPVYSKASLVWGLAKPRRYYMHSRSRKRTQFRFCFHFGLNSQSQKGPRSLTSMYYLCTHSYYFPRPENTEPYKLSDLKQQTLSSSYFWNPEVQKISRCW